MITIDALVYAKAHGGWSLEKEARGQTKVRYEHKRFRFDFYTCPDFASEDVVRGAAKGQAAENERSEDLQIFRRRSGRLTWCRISCCLVCPHGISNG